METLAKLEELEQKFGENPRRYFAALANEYRKNGEFDQAIELCRAQLEQQPDHLSGRVVLGQALFDAFRYEEARQELTTAIQLDPENFIALRLLGELAAQDGDQETARDFFSRARDIEPRNEQLLAALAALGPAEPPPTLADAVARTKTGPQPVFEETVDRVTESDAVAGAAMTAAEPVAEPTAPAPVAEPAPVGGVERFAESALGPPAKAERKRKTPVQRVEGLITTMLEPERPTEPPAEARAETEREAAIESRAAVPEPSIKARGVEVTETETPPETRPTIVTETMADLYLEQGHRAEAIEVLRQLVSQRPEDERLSRRLADLETTPVVSTVRDFFARFAARGGVEERAAPGPQQPSTGSLSGLFGESGSTLLDPESAALIAVTMPEPAATPTADEFENWVGRRRKP